LSKGLANGYSYWSNRDVIQQQPPRVNTCVYL